MSKKLEAFKIEFAKKLQDSDYTFRYDYDSIQDCLVIISIRDLLPSNTKFKIFKLLGTERILVQADRRFLIEYYIGQKGAKFELYEMNLSTYNEFERKIGELF